MIDLKLLHFQLVSASCLTCHVLASAQLNENVMRKSVNKLIGKLSNSSILELVLTLYVFPIVNKSASHRKKTLLLLIATSFH